MIALEMKPYDSCAEKKATNYKLLVREELFDTEYYCVVGTMYSTVHSIHSAGSEQAKLEKTKSIKGIQITRLRLGTRHGIGSGSC